MTRKRTRRALAAGAVRALSILAACLLGAARPLPAQTAAGGGAPPLTIAQLQYDGGGDWYANPTGLPNLLREIRERTGIPVHSEPRVTVRPTDPRLRDFPYIYVTGHGNIRLNPEEVAILREYLLGGGFLHADDNYGLDESFRREIARVFPDKEMVELPHDHPIYRVFYDFPDGIPKIHEHDGKPPQGFGIFHEGRLVVFYSYETDLGNGWEDPDVHDNPPEAREQAIRMGVNLFLYVLSQGAP